MSGAKASRATEKSVAKRQIEVKVRMDRGLKDQLDVVVGNGSRSELICDLVAHRLLPHPALATTLQLNRLCARIEQRLDSRDFLLNRYEDNPEQLDELRADIQDLRAATNSLQSTMAAELLRSAGVGAGRP